MADEIDIVHTWPLGALHTLEEASRLGIPTVMERPNAHTRFAYEAVRAECQRIGVSLPPGHEHAYDDDVLRVEEAEYQKAFRLLCPSDFVVQTSSTRHLGRPARAASLRLRRDDVLPGARPQPRTTGTQRAVRRRLCGP